MLHALTIDVEDYFQVHAFSEVIDPAQWDSFESRVERNTHRILDLLDSVKGPQSQGSKAATDDLNTYISAEPRPLIPGPCLSHDGHSPKPPRATFFILGWIAERYPGLTKEIQSRGHELACHGYAHQCIFNQTRDQFREDVRRAKGAIEDITGVEVSGYRAPTYSITRKNLWALETLFQAGFRYDSSIFPIRHDYYGFPEAPRFPFYLDFTGGDILSQFKDPTYLDFSYLKATAPHALHPMPYALCPTRHRFVEFPMSTITVSRLHLPFSGGGYFRLFPYQYSRWAFRKMTEKVGQPAVFYLHPWEIDSKVPRINGASRLSKFRTYVNLSRTEAKFKRLLTDFSFAPLGSLLCSALKVDS
jgi:polysaccharide deacetylase family protein (PEP-CTERM system associated)